MEIGIAKLVSSKSQAGWTQQSRVLGFHFNIAQGLESITHHGLTGNQPNHFMQSAIKGADTARQIHEPSALAVDGFSIRRKGGDSLAHRVILRKRFGVHFGIPTAEVKTIDLRKPFIVNGRKPHKLGAKVFQAAEIVLVVKVEGFVECEPDAATGSHYSGCF